MQDKEGVGLVKLLLECQLTLRCFITCLSVHLIRDTTIPAELVVCMHELYLVDHHHILDFDPNCKVCYLSSILHFDINSGLIKSHFHNWLLFSKDL